MISQEIDYNGEDTDISKLSVQKYARNYFNMSSIVAKKYMQKLFNKESLESLNEFIANNV
jgi:hypothetical protein